jgi:hypothetical protein
VEGFIVLVRGGSVEWGTQWGLWVGGVRKDDKDKALRVAWVSSHLSCLNVAK